MLLIERPLAVLDTETTGLDPIENEIIEIAVHIPTLNIHWVRKIKPERIETAHPKALEVNGYTPEKWEDAGTAAEVLEEANKLLAGCVLLGQNISFDIGFYNAACKRLGIKPSYDRRYVELYTLAYIHLVPCGLNSISLHSVCKFLGLSNVGEHTAMADVYRTWAAYQMLRDPGRLRRAMWRLKGWWIKRRKAQSQR